MEALYAQSNDSTNSLSIPEAEKGQSSSAPSSPTKAPLSFSEMMNKKNVGPSGSEKTNRSVKFPEDHSIVTGYHEAPDPFQFAVPSDEESDDQDLDQIVDAFVDACAKQNIEPMSNVLEQIKNFKSIRMRAQDLILRGQKLDAHQCEALEEILKRVLFRLIDLDSCDLDCDGASALFDMIEFYESASHLSIANNKSIGIIGWQALCRTLKKTSCLQYLDLSNTGLNEQILLFMGRTIRVGSHLVTLHLENAGLFGRRLAILVSSIKFNTSLRELYLGENKISAADCVQIGNLLRGNGYLNLLDLRNNFIQDTGLDHICEGLAHQPTTTSSSPTSVFGVFDSAPTKFNSMSQNVGVLILNLSNNQLTSRAMNRLAQTLSQCRSLIGLDLSYNTIGDEGILILREGLLHCKTLKYLNLSSTEITCEGATTIANVIRVNEYLTTIDLSNNEIGQNGLRSLRDAVAVNKRITKMVIMPQNNVHYESKPGSAELNQMLEQFDSYCSQHRMEATFDEFDSIISGFLRGDISVYQEVEVVDSDDNKENIESNFYSCDSSSTTVQCENPSNNNSFNEDDEDASKKPFLARTSSLGSWERPVKSGRFSVQPVDATVNHNNDTTDDGTPSAPPIQIQVESDNNSSISMVIQPTESLDNRSYSSEESDLSENETDQLPDLPTCFAKKNCLAPPQRSFRRMSSPAISVTGVVKPQKPKVNLSLKLSGNLESLDLKSSLPLSPTFFAKFDFSDISLLRLPAEVEEAIANINYSISDDLIFQFENFCCDKQTKKHGQHHQCVY